jgi:hypothetical protein
MQNAIDQVEKYYAELKLETDSVKRAFIYGKIGVATEELVSHAKYSLSLKNKK